MNILQELGLAPKNSKEPPIIGEQKKKEQENTTLKHNLYVRILVIIGFLGVLALSIPRISFKEPGSYSIGEPWRADNLTAPFTFAIEKSDKQLEKERETIRQSTPPIFHVNENAKIMAQAKVDSFFQALPSIEHTYQAWQRARRDTGRQASRDSIQFAKQKIQSPITLSSKGWNNLLKNYDSQHIDRLRQDINNMVNDVLNDGIINTPKEKISDGEIAIRNLKTRTERTLSLSNVRDMDEAQKYVRLRFDNNYNEQITQTTSEIADHILKPNYIFNEQDTQARIQDAIDNISKTKGAITEGENIIRRGDRITPEKYNELQSLAKARHQRASNLDNWLRYGGDVLIIMAIVTIFFLYLYLYRNYIFKNNALLLIALIAMALICVASSIVYQFESVSLYIVPVAVAPIILTVIFDSRVGLLCTITLALLTGLINGDNFEYVTSTIVACSLGLFSVRDIKKRSQFFFITPGIVFLGYAIVLIGFNLTTMQGWATLGNHVFYIFINFVLLLFASYPLILIFEKSFNVTTDFTLIELADTNLPLLKKLMTTAPGTFHHSLQVSNLAEAAAGEIGANALLCRAGGLYHDIGKMENPSYFTENQTNTNVHDKLKPRMSALVIKAHVSNGVRMAEEQNLPEIVIDFIRSHHGNSLIKYFWEKAKGQADEDKKEIREEDFRYDGPLPQTKETGILLLSDCVEAASRALKDPNYQKLETLIDKMVDDRVNEGQLSETSLTFQDLRDIKKTFLNILVGIYHSRVEYPDDEQEEDQERQPSDVEGSPATVDEYYNS